MSKRRALDFVISSLPRTRSSCIRAEEVKEDGLVVEFQLLNHKILYPIPYIYTLHIKPHTSSVCRITYLLGDPFHKRSESPFLDYIDIRSIQPFYQEHTKNKPRTPNKERKHRVAFSLAAPNPRQLPIQSSHLLHPAHCAVQRTSRTPRNCQKYKFSISCAWFRNGLLSKTE
jgi:hypothetical protein